tara:strand:- start:458 stop:913 length:456 start_codon:yes stop_codon:yes gene_type:complete
MEFIDYHQLYIQEKSRVDELQNTIHRINLSQNLTEYLNDIIVNKEDLEYCYETNLITCIKRCLTRNEYLPIKRHNNKVVVYNDDQWVIYTKEHSRKIWNNLHRKILKHFSNFDFTNKKYHFDIFVKKLFLYNIDVCEQHFFNFIKKNFIKK